MDGLPKDITNDGFVYFKYNIINVERRISIYNIIHNV